MITTASIHHGPGLEQPSDISSYLVVRIYAQYAFLVPSGYSRTRRNPKDLETK